MPRMLLQSLYPQHTVAKRSHRNPSFGGPISSCEDSSPIQSSLGPEALRCWNERAAGGVWVQHEPGLPGSSKYTCSVHTTHQETFLFSCLSTDTRMFQRKLGRKDRTIFICPVVLTLLTLFSPQGHTALGDGRIWAPWLSLRERGSENAKIEPCAGAQANRSAPQNQILTGQNCPPKTMAGLWKPPRDK